VLVNFWASWCHPCQEEAAALAAFAHTRRAHGRLVGIDVGDDAADGEKFVARYKWDFSALRDPSERVAGAYAVPGLPTTIILDSQSRIIGRLFGPQTEVSLSHALQLASAGHV